MTFNSEGSSPRMRGTPDRGTHGIRRHGIIPAYAGNTFTNLRLRKNTWDHPRVCGEHAFINGRRLPVKGSSPRMRGTLKVQRVRNSLRRIIPAYAGNTYPQVSPIVRTRDHPRVCGEHMWRSVLACVCAGSSPRMRGTQRCGHTDVSCTGIIPAYAGNTLRD